MTISDLGSATKLDLAIASVRGEITYTVLPTRKPKKSELILTRTNGVRTNTNRRGQNYNGHAVHAQTAITEGNSNSYFKTSG